jgi:hypothetical protein
MSTVTPDDIRDLDNWFTYHPATPEQLEHYKHVRSVSKDLAQYLLEKLPRSADRTAAIRSLRRTVMDINLAIACEGVS